MTISSTDRKAGPYIGNDVATAFPFAFKVFSAGDVYAVRADSAGDETDLALTTDYTISLNADQNANPGGTLTLLAPLASSYTLTISSKLDYLQPTDLTNNGGFYPKVITNALDRLTIFCQQLSEAVSRSLKTAISTPPGVDSQLPAPVPYALIGWNAAGDGFQNIDPTYSTALATDLANTDDPTKGAALVGVGDGAGGSLWVDVKGFIAWAASRFSDVIHADRFGTVGDGVADDTAALQNTFNAAVGKVLILGPQRTYKFTSLNIPAGVTLIACGSSFRRAAAAASYAIEINGDFIADRLVYSSPGSVAATDLGIKIAGSNVDIELLMSTVDTVDYGSFALRIEGAAQINNISIGKVKTQNWKSHIQVFNCDDVNIGDIDITSYVTGLYLRDVSNSSFAGGHIRTMSPSGAGTAGQNGILVESTLAPGSTHDVHFADFVIENAPEHGVRFGGQLSIIDIWMDRIKTRNTGAAGAGATGGCGIKILGASSVAGQKHKRFHLTDCTVNDVSVTGNGVGNFCGFILAVCEDVHLSNCNVGAVNQAESCQIGIDILSAERVTISNPIINKSKQAYIRFNADDPGVKPGFIPAVKDIHIIGGQLRHLSNSYGLFFVGLKGDFSEITVQGTVIYGGGPAAVVRADAPTTGSYGDIQINAIHRDPVDTTFGPALQCGNRFRYDWTGPYYGTFGSQGLDGSVFVDTTTGAYKLRKAGAWINL